MMMVQKFRFLIEEILNVRIVWFIFVAKMDAILQCIKDPYTTKTKPVVFTGIWDASLILFFFFSFFFT